jgi:NAD(P)-dependent dehydrogenase (short-subunit alcohol dehydrogenase family)
MSKQHAVIIGGTRGLGRALMKFWSERGDRRVSVVGRHSPSEPDRQWDNVDYWQKDVTVEGSVASLVDDMVRKNGKLSSLVLYQRYRGGSDDWEGELQVSLTATKEIIERAAHCFSPGGDRSIVVVSSIASQFIVKEQPVGYHVAKAGINQLVRYYAVKLGSRQIRVNSVSPGSVIKDESSEFYRKHRKFAAFYRSIIPLGRMGTMNEVAHVADFLCSRQASFMTGQNLVVDGGLSVQGHESLARELTPLRRVKVTRS